MAELTRDQAKAKAAELGIDHDSRAKTTAIIAAINDVTGETYTIAAPTDTAAAPVVTPAVTTMAAVTTSGSTGETTAAAGDDTIHCIIHSNDKDNDEVEVTGMLNGETYQAQLGEEVDFPKKFLPSINLAKEKQTIAILDKAGNPTGEYKTRWHKRYIIERL